MPSDVRNTEQVDWPKLCGIVNELEEARGYAALAFPTLFPYGPDGDPTVADRKVDVDLQLALKHLLQYGVKREDGTTCHPFAEHRRFPFWSLNTLQRKQTLARSNYYFTQNPYDALMTREEMQEMLAKPASVAALHKRLKNSMVQLMGTAAFWGAEGPAT